MKILAYWRIILALVAVALCGAVIGGAVALRWQQQRHAKQPPSRFSSEAFLDRWIQGLALTPEQEKTIRPQVERSRAELRTVTTQAMTQAEQIGRRLEEQVRPLLTPEQLTRLEQINEKRKQLRDRWQRGEHPPPSGKPRERGDRIHNGTTGPGAKPPPGAPEEKR